MKKTTDSAARDTINPLRLGGRFVRFLLTVGVSKTAGLTVDWVWDFLSDWRLGVNTRAFAGRSVIGYNNTDYIHYVPTRYRHIYNIINSIKTITENDVLLDYGCGMGRVLVVAAKYPFRKVIGVEISPLLATISEENIRRAGSKLNCRDVQVVTVDAASYSPPAEVTCFFLYDPFRGELLSRIIGNIRASLVDNPRGITVLWYGTKSLKSSSILDDCSWLQKCSEKTVSPYDQDNVLCIYMTVP
jgi:SAM-dependent methyltransferase